MTDTQRMDRTGDGRQCAECGTRDLVDRRARYECEPAGPYQYAPELCARCGAALCDSCTMAESHVCAELPAIVSPEYVEETIRQAAITLLWQASDAGEHGNGYPIGEDDFGRLNGQEGEDYIDAVIPLITEAVTAFVTENYGLLGHAGVTAGQAGHDFILTANGHGAGFWDRGLGAAGAMLTDATRGYSFDAEFRLWDDDADGDQHASDELAWLMVENTVLLDDLGWSDGHNTDDDVPRRHPDAYEYGEQ